MAKPKTTTSDEAPTVAIKFKQIACCDDGSLYALDEEGHVFWYIDDDKQQGWFQLDYDDVRELLETNDE